MHSVLLIDDDGKLAEVLSEYCVNFNIRIEPALLPSIAFEKIRENTFDAIILDVMLPEMDGGEVTDRIVGLELGADDYLPKPFDPRELVARLQVNIKRHKKAAGPDDNGQHDELHFEGLSIFPVKHEVHDSVGSSVELTTMEYSLLLLLAASPGKAFSRDEILSQLKGTEVELFSRSVDILVSRLRSKLKPLAPIRTIHGAGYAFVLPPIGEAS